MQQNKAVKAGLGYTIGNYLLKGLSFLTIPVFTRVLSTADYGLYNTFVAYEGILFVLIGLAIHTSYKNARYKFQLSEEGAEAGHDYQTYVSVSMVFLLISLAVWVLVANLLAGLLAPALGLDRVSINLLILYSFSSAVICCFNANASISYSYRSFLRVSAVNALGNILLSLILIYTVFPEQRYMGRVLGSTIPAVAVAAVIMIRFIRRARPRNPGHFLPWGLRYSLPIVPHGISQVLLSQFDRIMIRHMIGESQAGIYSFAFNISLIITVTVQALDNVWNQWFYEQMNAGAMKQIREKGSQYMALVLAAAAAIALISPEMVRLLAPESYGNAVYCGFPIVASAYFSFLYLLPSSVEYYREKTKYIAAGTMAAALMNIVLNYYFIRHYGYVAAAYTTLATYVLYFLFHYLLAWKIEGKSVFSHGTAVGCTLGMLLAMGGARLLLPYAGVRWGLAAVCGAGGIVMEERYLGLMKSFRSRFKTE